MRINLESTSSSFKFLTGGFLAAILSLGSLTMQSASAQAPIPMSAPQPRQIAATNANPLVLSNHTPFKVLDGTAARVSHYNPEQKLRLVLTVHPPHMAEEEQFIKELVTKGSPNFHKFLTLEQWNERYAPSVEDEQAVVDWAQSVGLTVTKRYSDRLIVSVEGSVGTIENAFGVTINNYKVGDEVDFSNDRDPVIPAKLSGILTFVTGLSNIERTHRIGSRHATVKGADYVPGPEISEGQRVHGDGDPAKAPVTRPMAMKSREAARNMSESPTKPKANDNYPLDDMGGTYAMDPDNVQSSNGYDYNALQRLSFCCNEPGASGGSPPESSIALVGYGGFLGSDISTFAGAYGMAYDYTYYCIGGDACPGNDGEAPLDVEYSLAMSNSYGSYQNTAQIFEYEMTNGLYSTYEAAFNDIVSDGHAKVVSTSYGWQENVGFSGTVATGTMHPIFNTMVGTGITLIAASGDNGASDGCGDATSVDYPSSDPDFLAAGGTQLDMYANGIFYSETGWQGESWSGACGSNHGGSTGGVSVLFAAPSWQTATTTAYPDGIDGHFYLWKAGSEYVETGNGNRMVPDLSLTANPDVLGQWYVSGGSWQDEGGTSIVAPELAGFFAQENSYLDYIGDACGGSGTSACSPVGLATPWIYYNGLYGATHSPFYDMLSGCNDNDITAADDLFYYCAYTGWDPETGWGSANMMQLAWGINWEIIPADGAPSISFGGPAINTWYNTDQIVDWVLSDGSGNGYTPPGAAGFTQGWDSIPPDSYSEPHGGDGDTFYTGPQYTYSTFGCLDNTGASCAGSSGQGCHTVFVRGWDNQGNTTNGSYGPVCFDNVAPTISAATNPATSGTVWVDKSVTVTLTANDPGGSAASGLYKTYYAINSGSCYPGSVSSCSVYTGPFTISAQGQTYIYYFTEDNAGNYSSEPYIWVSIDTAVPVTTASLGGTINSGTTYKTAVQVTLSATTTGGSGIAHTYYELDGGAQTTYGSPFTVSTLGSHTVKYWSVSGSGEVESTHTTSFSIVSPTTAVLTATPTPSLVGQSVTMTATVTANVSGTPTGSVTFYNGATNLGSGTLSGGVAHLSTTALPAGNLTLQASYPGAGNFLATNSAPYTQRVVTSYATLTSPTPSTTLAGPNVTFSWGSVSGATGYYLWIGSTGAGSNNLYNSGLKTSTSLAVTGLPTNGEALYVRLFTSFNGTLEHNDYTYTAATQSALTSPTPSTLLPGPNVTFSWTAGVGATGYTLWLGSTGAGSSNLLNSGNKTVTSLAVSSLPTNGETIYVRLFTNFNGTLVHSDYTYTAVQQAAMSTPAPSTLLPGVNVTFSWTAGTGASGYYLWVGTTAGSYNLYNSGDKTVTSLVVSGLPTNGETIYVRLFTNYNNILVHTDYTYTAVTASSMTSPTPGSTFTGTSQTFTWTAGSGATGYYLWLGTTAGSYNLYNSGDVTVTTKTVTGLPTNGETIYARLFTNFNGQLTHVDYTYTAK
jgi:Pro-kumamolisin, activation domain/Bacterial Ig-like domain (group 3)